MKYTIMSLFLIIYQLSACAQKDNAIAETDMVSAEVTNVVISGEENKYTFSVAIKSSDQGCNQYADWWEVVSEEGKLLYRRLLMHSHVNEQPFTRSGGPVEITKDRVVYIRAHMNTIGYGNVIFKGSVSSGFHQETLETSFASELETTAPLPDGCAF